MHLFDAIVEIFASFLPNAVKRYVQRAVTNASLKNDGRWTSEGLEIVVDWTSDAYLHHIFIMLMVSSIYYAAYSLTVRSAMVCHLYLLY